MLSVERRYWIYPGQIICSGQIIYTGQIIGLHLFEPLEHVRHRRLRQLACVLGVDGEIGPRVCERESGGER